MNECEGEVKGSVWGGNQKDRRVNKEVKWGVSMMQVLCAHE
jgi:hypothetical protein